MEATPRRLASRFAALKKRDRESGFVLVWMALSFIVLIGLAGFSVDLGNWYLRISRAQAAADSAALAGAVYLPDAPDQALIAARASLVSNGVTPKHVQSADIHPVTKGGGDLTVAIDTDAHNAFVPLLGFADMTTFHVQSTSRYQPGLGIGDYSNVLGSEPGPNPWQDPEKTKRQGEFWLGNTGGQDEKQSGDRYSTQKCTDAASGCAGGRNLEQRKDKDGTHTGGYDFVVSAEKGQPGTSIEVQAYDPAFAETGEHCDAPDYQQLYTASNNNPRYAPTPGGYCPGDHQDAGGTPVTASFQFFDFNTKQPVASCPNRLTFSAWTPPLSQHLQDPKFLAQFHQWVSLCNLPYDSAKGSKYILRVEAGISEEGENFYSLRAGLTNAPSGLATTTTPILQAPTNSSVRVFAKTDLPLWANINGASTQFAIASIPPSYAGQEVSLELFDLGDASKPGTLSILSSSGFTGGAGGSTTTNCLYKPPKSNTAQKLTNCSLPNVQDSTGFQGQAFTIIWKVPANYTCDPTGANPLQTCFMFLRLDYPAGTKVNDRTTWTATGESQPLRLIPNPKTSVQQATQPVTGP